MGLIKTLVDRAYKINNTWLGFHEDINNLTDILKESFPCSFNREDYKPLRHWDPKESSSPGFPSYHFTYVLL